MRIGIYARVSTRTKAATCNSARRAVASEVEDLTSSANTLTWANAERRTHAPNLIYSWTCALIGSHALQSICFWRWRSSGRWASSSSAVRWERTLLYKVLSGGSFDRRKILVCRSPLKPQARLALRQDPETGFTSGPRDQVATQFSLQPNRNSLYT
jgi:hypothetical protein